MKIIDNAESEFIRDLFLDVFVVTNSENYQIEIERNHAGYYWDHFKNPKCVSEHFCLETIQEHSLLYVMWDDNIFISDEIRYFKTAVLQMTPEEFLMQYNTLPSDIYVFDSSFEWCIALTHEYLLGKKQKRYCLYLTVYNT